MGSLIVHLGYDFSLYIFFVCVCICMCINFNILSGITVIGESSSGGEGQQKGNCHALCTIPLVLTSRPGFILDHCCLLALYNKYSHWKDTAQMQAKYT